MTLPVTAAGKWQMAVRGRTLSAAALPVIVGSALAYREGFFHLVTALCALLGALLIQIGANLINDAADYQRGADTAERLGPPRATSSGLLPYHAVYRAGVGCLIVSILPGAYLVYQGGLPIFIVGITSVAAAYLYTAGPFPLSYAGLGDIFVLIFFGLVAVCGTFFVQAHYLSGVAVASGLAVGLMGVALLAVNNTRDLVTDEKAQKRTLVVRFGRDFGRAEHLWCLAGAFIIPAILVIGGTVGPWLLLTFIAIPLAIIPVQVMRTKDGAELNRALNLTSLTMLVFGILYAVGLLV